jgi:hypothetical protein
VPFDVNVEEGERLIANLAFVASRNAEAFRIAITDRAIFLSRKKFFAVSDPTYSERVPLSQVVEVKVKRLNPYFLWALTLLMVVGGTITTALMFLPVLRGEAADISGYPPAVALVGLVIPFIARRRYGLSIQMVMGDFLWKPPLLVDRVSRNAVDHFLTQAADAFRQSGVKLADERDPAHLRLPGIFKTSAYPVAGRFDEPSSLRGVRRACFHCGKALRISRWDDWNGFLFRCPCCGGTHGKPWNASITLLASIFLNGLSFFLTMRWKRALPLFLGFALLCASVSFVLDRGSLPETPKLVLLGIFLLGPLAINSTLLLQHEMALKAASTSQTPLDE